ncbi:hypothetical protein H8356DRAFT_1700605 [Neocallimastix lanati (nom. inval.)]|uniref:Myb-like domain-containing protein n=1 Tax=Neocallimastix californiae TaxID=1754190 RepID=A0A1Y2C433_9FUNG|nr:hypothetical protein H8356DRAFT_1700605 [Neocallimastix sp. JGI-2020a]ORY41788.1 hypothetical protein LY90DRAFT_458363 [Neocallimastix californiae]|eukprot:ORY41788.1 hypothetical protein LY90DRAFT_458363 [Neocallimastix californiae]
MVVEKELNDENKLKSIKEALDKKHEWVKEMRKKFCVRKEFENTKILILEDGTLNQDYFRLSKGTVLKTNEVRKWTSVERGLLIKGIEKYGIGHFREISENLLPKWSGNDLRIKTIHLIGRQNLKLYKDWKGNEEDIKREYNRNKEIGLKCNAWKNNCLVDDGNGKVKELIEATEKKNH